MYINRGGNECEIIRHFKEKYGCCKTITVYECRITKGVTTATGLVFTISEPQFLRDWQVKK